MYVSMFCSTSLCVSCKPPDLQIHRQGQCFQHFSSFCVLGFLGEDSLKNRRKTEPSKDVEKSVRLDPKIDPKSLKNRRVGDKNRQECPEKAFFGSVNFSVIFWRDRLAYSGDLLSVLGSKKRKGAAHFLAFFQTFSQTSAWLVIFAFL